MVTYGGKQLAFVPNGLHCCRRRGFCVCVGELIIGSVVRSHTIMPALGSKMGRGRGGTHGRTHPTF